MLKCPDDIKLLCISETKIDSSLPDSQLAINGFKNSFRLNVNSRSGALILYVSDDISSRQLKGITVPSDIQLVPIEMKLQNGYIYAFIYHHH